LRNWQAEFPFELAAYSCPLVNPPAQRHLFENKIHNIRLAISRVVPPVLEHGEEFSFWRFAGVPTADNGYREGAMFVNRRVTTSLGGGLCQLSGLIYNLALLSGLRIVERHNHSIDAYGEERYIPLGHDATVAYGRKDLRFLNPHPFPVTLELDVDERRAWGAVRGAQDLDCRIHIETLLVETIPSPLRRRADASVAVGDEIVEPGLTGKRVRAWRIFERAGGPSRRERLSYDRYRETPTRVRYGATPAVARMRRLLGILGLHG